MVPEFNRPEWMMMATGKSKPEIKSFSLQMKLNSLVNAYKGGFMSAETAAKELYDMCVKYERIYQEDLNRIFNQTPA